MPTASDIVERARAVYAGCSTYRDTGESTTVFINGVRPTERRTKALEFRTEFVRPDRFYFEFTKREVGPRSEWNRYVVWANHEVIRSWWSMGNRTEEFESLSMAIAGPTGISGGTAHSIPSLLLTIAGRTLLEGDLELDREGHIDDARCYCLSHTFGDRDETVWVAAESHVILRLDVRARFQPEAMAAEHETRLDVYRRKAAEDGPGSASARTLERLEREPPRISAPFTTEQTILYRPHLDVPIAADVFEFEPPG